MSPHEYNPLRLIQALGEEATVLSRARQEDFRRGRRHSDPDYQRFDVKPESLNL